MSMCDTRNTPTHLVVFASKQLDTHDGKDQPEYETHQQYIEDGGYGLDQGIHDNLRCRNNKSFCKINKHSNTTLNNKNLLWKKRY